MELTDSITDILLSGSTAQKTEPTDIASAMLRAKAGRSSYGEELNRIKAQKISESQNLMKTMTWLMERQSKDAALKRQDELDRRTARNQMAAFASQQIEKYDLAGGVGANARMGVATLVAGTVTVANTSVTANTRVAPFRQAGGGTLGDLSATKINGTSFTITSSSNTDTSTVAWLLIDAA